MLVDFEALYKFRFRDVDLDKRKEVWVPISHFIYEMSGRPKSVLDPACGLGEFINSIPANERWALDLGINGQELEDGIKFEQCSFTESNLPSGHFDLIFMSNVLEHLPNQEAVNQFLIKAKDLLSNKGVVVIMGPNFKYCAKDYFDCADHSLALTHISIEEHLAAAGFETNKVIPKFLPYSFRSRLPASDRLTSMYLKSSLIWRILGKQFLIMAAPKIG